MRFALVLAVATLLAPASLCSADALPPPGRPGPEWEEAPLPTPTPAAVALVATLVVAGTLVTVRRRS